MPQVVLFVAAIGSAVIGAVGGAAFLAGLSLSAFVGVTLVAGTAIIAGGAMLATKLLTPDMPGVPDTDRSRQVTSKSTVEPMKIIYGQALVSGPLAFLGLSGSDNQDLHHVIALAGHEVEAITDVWLDDEVITNPIGPVTSGTFGPVSVSGSSITQVYVAKYLGTAGQTADPILVQRFADYSANNKGQGIAYIHTIFTLLEATASQELWGKYSPNNIRAIVKGRKIYDPRLDVAAGNTAGANPANATYIAYSDNPALCVADYLTNTQFGMGIATNKIDWPEVIVAADACDVSVPVPGGTEKRFTANGVLFGTDPHMTSINKLLSSMNGSLVYSGGEYIISAGVYKAPSHVLTEDDLAGPVTVKTSVERSDRFNAVKSIIIDPLQNHKSVEAPRVQLTAALVRDNNETLEREIELPFTNSSYMAQRIANKLIQMSDQQKLLTFPANLSAMAITVGDRVEVTIGELGFSSKVFRCMGWSFTESGISLTLAEDDPGSYEDPDAIAYSTVSAAGVITNGFPGVPDPQGLIAVGGVKSIDLNWRNPSNTSKFSSVIIYASPTDQWSAAVEIGRGIITSFKHDASTEADPITSGDQRWYWVRAIGIGSSANVFSDRNPDNDQSNVTATALTNAADSVEWENVADSTDNKPDDSAYGVKVDGNNRITGFGLNSTPATAEPFSEFYIVADKFAVVNPASTADTPIVPFEVASGLITMGTNVRINGDLVTTGTIDAARIDVAGVITAGSLVIVTDIENFIEGSEVNSNVTSISGSVITTGTIIADKIVLDGTTLAASGDSLGIKDGGVNTTQITANAVSKFSSTTTVATGPVVLNVEYVILTDTITTNGGEVVAWADLQFERFVTSRAGVFRLYIGGTLVAQRSLLSTKDQVTIMGRRAAFAAGTYVVKLAVLLTAGSMGDIDDGTLISMESKR